MGASECAADDPECLVDECKANDSCQECGVECTTFTGGEGGGDDDDEDGGCSVPSGCKNAAGDGGCAILCYRDAMWVEYDGM